MLPWDLVLLLEVLSLWKPLHCVFFFFLFLTILFPILLKLLFSTSPLLLHSPHDGNAIIFFPGMSSVPENTAANVYRVLAVSHLILITTVKYEIQTSQKMTSPPLASSPLLGAPLPTFSFSELLRVVQVPLSRLVSDSFLLSSEGL